MIGALDDVVGETDVVTDAAGSLSVDLPQAVAGPASRASTTGSTDTAAHDHPSPEFREHPALVRRITTDTFGGRLDDGEHVVAARTAHNRSVREKAPVDRLLVYEAGQGWQPLCAFLGVEVPDGVASADPATSGLP